MREPQSAAPPSSAPDHRDIAGKQCNNLSDKFLAQSSCAAADVDETERIGMAVPTLKLIVEFYLTNF
jgi:hypothetical protein